MNCTNENECACPKVECPRHGKCCDCVVRHRDNDSLPFCMFPDSNGDRSVRGYYEMLKKRFDVAVK